MARYVANATKPDRCLVEWTITAIDLESAWNHAERHCELRGYKIVSVNPIMASDHSLPARVESESLG